MKREPALCSFGRAGHHDASALPRVVEVQAEFVKELMPTIWFAIPAKPKH
jgi:hypothetical protein